MAPSRLAGEETVPPAAAPHGQKDPSGRRFRRGTLIHALLQHLPEHPEAAREAVAQRHLARPGHGLSPEEQEATAEYFERSRMTSSSVMSLTSPSA